jgi:hypothetical protein
MSGAKATTRQRWQGVEGKRWTCKAACLGHRDTRHSTLSESGFVCVGLWLISLRFSTTLREKASLADGEVATVFAAAALSVLSPAKRPDPPLLTAPAIETASSFLSASSIKAAASISTLPAVVS